MRRRKLRAALGLTLALAAGTAQAADIPDSLTITITPNGYYAVDITTNGPDLDLGYVNVNTATQTVKPATVTVQSSWATTDLRLQGTALDTWFLDTDATAGEQNALQAWAVFTDTSVAAAPTKAGGTFVGDTLAAPSDLISTTNRYVGASATHGDAWFVRNSGDPGYKTMDAITNEATDAAASRSHLWFYFKTPPSTTIGTAQRLYVTLTATAPN